MTTKIRKINILYNSTNDNILKYPSDTLLDKIFIDLWDEIIRYINFHPFVLGDNETKYFGYRLMKTEEFNQYKDKFIAYYFQNEKTIYSLKEWGAENTLLVIGNRLPKLQRTFNSYIFCRCEAGKKNNVRFSDIANDMYLSSEMSSGCTNKLLFLMVFDREN